MLEWQSHASQRTGGKLREPLLGENFSGIDAIADSLLREAVQNSLDARLDPTQPVRVRVFVSGDEGALTSEQARPWFAGAWPHFAADLATKDAHPAERCRFVVVEDFNTRGLQGDVSACSPMPGNHNPWFLFFRVEGQSHKTDDARGRWGVGKVVFPLSSRTRSFFAATVREGDPSHYVMGQAMLRSRLVDGVSYDPDLWFCELDTDGFEMPSTRAADYESLKRSFSLKRRDEPGLSIVVPYADEDISREALLLAAVREYFYPILTRALVIEIEAHGHPKITLDAGSIEHLADELPPTAGDEVVPLVKMAAWLIARGDTLDRASSPPSNGAPRWEDTLLPTDLSERLRSALDAGQIAGLRIPTKVTERSGASYDTHFDLVLQRSNDSNLRRAAYVRSDLVIPDVKGRQVRGFHALVVATDRPIVTMLGDAENPAHTDWHVRTSNFKDKYKFGPGQLDYVKHSASNVCHTLTIADGLRHRDAIGEYFYVPEPSAPLPAGGTGGRRGPQPDPRPRPIPSPRPQQFVVTRVRGGFSISATETPLMPGHGIEVAVAYDVRGGDPIGRFHPADFKLTQLQREMTDLVVKHIDANVLRVMPTSTAFRLEIKGFDENRDLFVKARVVEVPE